MKSLLFFLVVLVIAAVILFSGFGVSGSVVGKVFFYCCLIALMVTAVSPVLQKKH